MNIDNWPDCPVPGCTNKICLSLESDRCFPHTPGNDHIKRWKIALLHDLPIFPPHADWEKAAKPGLVE